MLNCSLIHACSPIACTCAASFGVGPKAARSRNLRAAAADTSAPGLPTCTAKGADTDAPFATVRFTCPLCAANPLTVSVPLEYTVVSGEPFRLAIEVARNPVPVMVVENTPSGSGLVPMPVITGAGGLSFTVAEAEPPGPVAVTVSVPDAG